MAFTFIARLLTAPGSPSSRKKVPDITRLPLMFGTKIVKPIRYRLHKERTRLPGPWYWPFGRVVTTYYIDSPFLRAGPMDETTARAALAQLHSRFI